MLDFGFDGSLNPLAVSVLLRWLHRSEPMPLDYRVHLIQIQEDAGFKRPLNLVLQEWQRWKDVGILSHIYPTFHHQENDDWNFAVQCSTTLRSLTLKAEDPYYDLRGDSLLNIVDFTHCIADSASQLRVLHLNGKTRWRLPKDPGMLAFPNLEELHFSVGELNNIDRFLAACPVLSKFHIEILANITLPNRAWAHPTVISNLLHLKIMSETYHVTEVLLDRLSCPSVRSLSVIEKEVISPQYLREVVAFTRVTARSLVKVLKLHHPPIPSYFPPDWFPEYVDALKQICILLPSLERFDVTGAFINEDVINFLRVPFVVGGDTPDARNPSLSEIRIRIGIDQVEMESLEEMIVSRWRLGNLRIAEVFMEGFGDFAATSERLHVCKEEGLTLSSPSLDAPGTGIHDTDFVDAVYDDA